MLSRKLIGLEQTLFIGLLAASLGSVVLPVTGFGESTDQQYTIKLKSRTFIPTPGVRLEDFDATHPADNYHVLIQFYDLPNEAQRQALETAGILLLKYIPQNTWTASIKQPTGQLMNELSTTLNFIRWSGPLLPSDKVSPDISGNSFGEWAKNGDGTVNLSLRIFTDVDLPEMSERVVARGGEVTEMIPILSKLNIKWPESISVLELAQEDSIQWIAQAPPPKEEVNDGLRANLGTDRVHMPLYSGYGLTGNGINTAIWDGGHVDDTHLDFTGRVIFDDFPVPPSPPPYGVHATHVAGTMAGAGIINSLYKGVAPQATIISFDWDFNIIEHNNTHEVSQNSWGYGVSSDNGNCSWYGDYDIDSPDYDDIVTGVLVLDTHIPVVFAGGNERNDGDCGMSSVLPYINYGNITPGGTTAKNTITVGAINSDNDTMTDFSSWGPTDDGRIKPEVVAPGDESGSSAIRSTAPGDTYLEMQGTSMSAPAVSGSIALLKEQYNKICSTSIKILPSTLKALLTHTARDLLDDTTSWYNLGPDYASGYGAINIKAAIDMLPFHVQGNIDHGDLDEYQIVVTRQQDLKVTLVWDDPAAALGALSTLMNDLDLELEDPNGVIYHPWVLNPASPADPATTGTDNINIIEQVSVATVSATMTGTWTIRVRGAHVPAGPQRYSLVSPHLADYSNCSNTDAADVWIKDGINDTGAEPSPPGSCGGWWCSEDIVITQNDSATTGLGQPLPTHQNPEVGQDNFAYVLVRNRGTQPANNVRVNLYLTPAATGLSWPGDWELIGSSTIPELPASQTYLIEPVAWEPPAIGHYCMVARLVTTQDPMTVPENSDITHNTRENNNIAWRNLNIVDLLPNSVADIDFIIRNISPTNTTARLVLHATNPQGKPIAINDQTNKLILEWPDTLPINGSLEGFFVRDDGVSAEVIGKDATINEIEMSGHEEHSLTLSFDTIALSHDELPKGYLLHVVQYADDGTEPIGGITYQVRPAVPMAVKLSDFKVTASQEGVNLEWETAQKDDHAKFTIWRGNPLTGTCTTNPLDYDDVRKVLSINTPGTVVENSTFYSKTDSDVALGKTYCYLLQDTDFSGNNHYHWNLLRAITLPTNNKVQ
jgi:hypothetical protein